MKGKLLSFICVLLMSPFVYAQSAEDIRNQIIDNYRECPEDAISELCGFDIKLCKYISMDDFESSIPEGYRLPTPEELEKIAMLDQKYQEALFRKHYALPYRYEYMIVLTSKSRFGSGQFTVIQKTPIYRYSVFDSYIVKNPGFLKKQSTNYINMVYRRRRDAMTIGPIETRELGIICGIFVKK